MRSLLLAGLALAALAAPAQAFNFGAILQAGNGNSIGPSSQAIPANPIDQVFATNVIAGASVGNNNHNQFNQRAGKWSINEGYGLQVGNGNYQHTDQQTDNGSGYIATGVTLLCSKWFCIPVPYAIPVPTHLNSNKAWTVQLGDDNYALTYQRKGTGPGNVSGILQVGWANGAAVFQVGGNSQKTIQIGLLNASVTGQFGEDNKSTTVQLGALNGAISLQAGDKNKSTTIQVGVLNGALTLQGGDNNKSKTVQAGILNGAATVQLGHANEATTVHAGIGNVALTGQVGAHNDATTVQLGGDNLAITGQVGAHNDASTVQVGAHNVATTTQIGTNNSSTVKQVGLGNNAAVSQDSQRNWAAVGQYGDGNSATLTQTTY